MVEVLCLKQTEHEPAELHQESGGVQLCPNPHIAKVADYCLIGLIVCNAQYQLGNPDVLLQLELLNLALIKQSNLGPYRRITSIRCCM